MEGVVTMVDAMTSAVDAVEAMVTAVEMRAWLEVGRPETERITAIHFFSRALVVVKQKDDIRGTRRYSRPLYWPGLLPGLVHLLGDCLLPHNSKAIQSGAMLSIKYRVLTLAVIDRYFLDADQYHGEYISRAWDPLLRLVRETDCTEIRDQAVWSLGRMANRGDTRWVVGFLPLLTDLIRHYAAISEPTDAEISSLNTAIKALTQALDSQSLHQQPSWEQHILEILPLLIGIFQEPGKRKKAQIRVGAFLAKLVWLLDGNIFLQNGTIEMLLETVRVGKEPTAVLVNALRVIGYFLCENTNFVNNGMVYVNNALDMGALDVFHLVLQRPNDRFKNCTLWTGAIEAIGDTIGEATGQNMEAVLSLEGLVELVLERALGMDVSEETVYYHCRTMSLLQCCLTRHCSESQMRGLILKGPLFHLLHRHLNRGDFGQMTLMTVQDCLARSSVADRRTIRLLLDDTGITDDIRRISLAVPEYHYQQDQKDVACNILDTYLNHPLPPLPPHNLPSIIYTRNVPS